MDAAWPGLVVEQANLGGADLGDSPRTRSGARRRGLDRDVGAARLSFRRASDGDRRPCGRPAALADRKRTNLPRALTSFVGRERELAEIKRPVADTRSLTLTGTGGIGKTRLALQAAAEVLDAYRDGVWFVDFAPLDDPALVPSALAQVLGMKEAIAQSLLDALCDHCARKGDAAGLRQLRARAGAAPIGRRVGARHLASDGGRDESRIIAYRPAETYPLGALPLAAAKPTPRPLPAPMRCGCSSIARDSIGRGSISRERGHARSP